MDELRCGVGISHQVFSAGRCTAAEHLTPFAYSAGPGWLLCLLFPLAPKSDASSIFTSSLWTCR